jgi:hypothetical protein
MIGGAFTETTGKSTGKSTGTTIHYPNRTWPIEDEDLLRIIFLYVGKRQYFLVGSVKKSFHKVYVSLFPETETYPNGSSIAMLNFCWKEFEHPKTCCRWKCTDDEKTIQSYNPTEQYRYSHRHHIEVWKTRNRNILWDSAIRCGQVDVVQYFLKVLLYSPEAQKGNERHIDYFDLSYFTRFHQDYCHLDLKAAKHGQLELLQWAHRQKIGLTPSHYERVCTTALGHGHMDIYRWAVQNGFRWNDAEDFPLAASLAAQHGAISTLQWFHETKHDLSKCYDDFDKTGLCDVAAKNGQVTVLQWLRSIQHVDHRAFRNHPDNDDDTNNDNDDINRRYFNHHRDDECPWNTYTVCFACCYGHLEAVKFLLDHGGRVDNKTCYYAAFSGSVPILQFLRSRGAEWDELVPAYAAAFGHIDLIEWAVSNGCPWSETTCHHAAAYGKLRTLQWLRTNGCPWNGMTACYGKNEEIYEWAISNGCPIITGNRQVKLDSRLMECLIDVQIFSFP